MTGEAPRRERGPVTTGGRGGAGRISTRRPISLVSWATVGLVLVIVIVLVVLKATGGTPFVAVSEVPASPQVVHAVTDEPASAFNAVGTRSSLEPVTPPVVIRGQSALSFSVAGTDRPGVFYYGAEYCPFCAAERWPLTVALARFGTFSHLGEVASAAQNEQFPSTETLSYYGSSYSSPYLAFRSVEADSSQPNPNGSGYEPLQSPDKSEQALLAKYDTTRYIGSASGTFGGSLPFIDFGNKVLVAGASFSPALIQGLSRNQIATALKDPANPVAQGILTAANYLSAAACDADGNRPASVCVSKGVRGAAQVMGL